MKLHPRLVVNQRFALEDQTEWLVERVTPASATVRCVAGKPAQVRHVEFADGRSADFLSRAGERMTISAHAAVRLLVLLLALLPGACESPTAPSKCEAVQWTVLALVPACCTADNPYGPTYAGVRFVTPADTSNGAAFPYRVPDGRWLGFGTIEVSSKLFEQNGVGRGSYFHLSFAQVHPGDPQRTLVEIRDTLLISVPTTAPYMRFSPPLRAEPGKVVLADFMNGSKEDQFMSATLTGYLADNPSFQGCIQ